MTNVASREIRDLSPGVQVLHNKFFDRCRRDQNMLKAGITMLLTCTYRTHDEQVKVHDMGGGPRTSRISSVATNGKPASESFEMVPLVHGMPAVLPPEWANVVADHAAASGLEAETAGPIAVRFKARL